MTENFEGGARGDAAFCGALGAAGLYAVHVAAWDDEILLAEAGLSGSINLAHNPYSIKSPWNYVVGMSFILGSYGLWLTRRKHALTPIDALLGLCIITGEVGLPIILSWWWKRRQFAANRGYRLSDQVVADGSIDHAEARSGTGGRDRGYRE